jgi:hypothetical protein
MSFRIFEKCQDTVLKSETIHIFFRVAYSVKRYSFCCCRSTDSPRIMAKKTKKRRHDDISLALSSSSIPDAATSRVARLRLPAEESIESLLAEMEGDVSSVVVEVSSQPSSGESIVAEPGNSEPLSSQLADNELWNPTLVRRRLTNAQRERIATWNRALAQWQKTSAAGTYTPGLLPSFDVELTRHFKVQALSTYLLDACKQLKMPAFERWYDTTLIRYPQLFYYFWSYRPHFLV